MLIELANRLCICFACICRSGSVVIENSLPLSGRKIAEIGQRPGTAALVSWPLLSLPLSRRRVRVGRAGRYDRVLLQACLELRDHRRHGRDGPGVLDGNREFFLGIEDEVEEFRSAEHLRRREPVVLFIVEVQFPIAPLHRLEAICVEQQDAFAVRGLRLAHQEITLIHAVDGPVLRHRSRF